MRRRIPFLAALFVATAAAANIQLETSVRVEFTNCASGGSSSTSLPSPGRYLMRVTDEDTFLCWGATCASGGEKFPTGTVMLLHFRTAQALSCRSGSSLGDVILTFAN